MKFLLPFLMVVFVLAAESCKKSCNYPEYQYQNVCYPSYGYKYVGDYVGTDSTSVGSQNTLHRVLVGTQAANSIQITQLAPVAQLDAQGHFVIDTQHVIINEHGFTIFGGGYFLDTVPNDILVTNMYFISDSILPSYFLHFQGLR